MTLPGNGIRAEPVLSRPQFVVGERTPFRRAGVSHGETKLHGTVAVDWRNFWSTRTLEHRGYAPAMIRALHMQMTKI